MSTAVNSTHTSVPASSRALSSSANHPHTDSGYTNGHHHHHHDVASGSGAAKKGKGKKTTDPNEASNLIAAKISQLELDAAGEQEQEAEIGWSSSFYFPPHAPLLRVGHTKGEDILRKVVIREPWNPRSSTDISAVNGLATVFSFYPPLLSTLMGCFVLCKDIY
jgi:hypothetical protein